MKELSLQELENISKSGREFAGPNQAAARSVPLRPTLATGAGLASTTGRAPLGFWVIGAALRALWLKV